MHIKNDETIRPGNLTLVGNEGGTSDLTSAEVTLIQHIRRMGPAIQKMMFDLAAENVRRIAPKAGAVLKLVRAPK